MGEGIEEGMRRQERDWPLKKAKAPCGLKGCRRFHLKGFSFTIPKKKFRALAQVSKVTENAPETQGRKMQWPQHDVDL